MMDGVEGDNDVGCDGDRVSVSTTMGGVCYVSVVLVTANATMTISRQHTHHRCIICHRGQCHFIINALWRRWSCICVCMCVRSHVDEMRVVTHG